MSDPTPAQNARFRDEGGGTISEMMSNQVQFFYDPTTGAASANFNGLPYLSIGSIYRSLGDVVPDILAVDFTNKLAKCYGAHVAPLIDPVTGADLTKVSVAGVMMLMKAAYDEEFNDRAAARIVLAAQIAALQSVMAFVDSAVASPAADGSTANFTHATSGLTVAFTDTSIAPGNETATQWGWYFSDGASSSTVANPTYTFSKAGSYQVIMAARLANGTVARTAQTIVVTG